MGALARAEHLLEMGFGDLFGLGGVGFFVFEGWF